MIRELKFLFYLISIFLFLFFCGKYYFSDQHKKKSYKSHVNLNNRINKLSENLLFLKSNTENIITYVENKENKYKKRYQFWKLLSNND